MGRIPLLLPLNVKSAEAAGQAPDPAARLNSSVSANARRASYAYGASETGSFSGPSRAREARPSAASGSDALGGLAVARTEAGLLSGREARALGSPRTTSISSTASLSPSPSAHISSDGSIFSRAGSNGRQTGLPNPFGTAGAGDRWPSHDGGTAAAAPGSITARVSSQLVSRISEIAPLLSTTSIIPTRPSAPRAPSPSVWRSAPIPSAVDPHGAARSPVPVVGAAAASGTPSPLLSGSSLVQLALSSCSTAEQQLRELLSPVPASPAPALLPTLPQGPVSVRPPSGSRRLMVPASPVSSSTTAPGYRSSASLSVRLEPHRLAVSACSSPVTSPVAHYGPTAGAAGRDGGGAAGGGGGAGGGLLAALLDHRQMLAPAHPSAGRPERVTRFALNANGNGSGTGEPLEGVGGAEERAEERMSPRPVHAAALVRQLREEQEASGSPAAAVMQQLMLQQQHHQHQHQQDGQQDLKQQHQEHGKSRKTGVMWAALLPGAARDDHASGGDATASNGAGSAAGQAAAPALTAAAMRVVQELKDMDEFSLVAAARQRQQQLAARTLTKQPTSKKLSSAVGSRSMHESRRSLCGQGGLGGGGVGEGSGGEGSGGQHLSLPHLLAAARMSCPTENSLAEPAELETRGGDIAGGGGSGGNSGGSTAASPLRRHADGDSAGDAAAGASPTTGDHTGDGGGGGGSFLPAVMSPRPAAAASISARSLMSVASVGAPGAPSRAGGSAPTGTTGAPRPSEFGTTAAAAPAASAGQVAELEAAAALRALEARFGSAVLPDSRTLWDQDEHDPAVRERRKKLYEALQAANPAAYHEEAAEAAEAAYRALSERAQLRFRKLLQEATTQEAPLRQLEGALRELTSQRPFFLPPVISKPKVERTYVEADNKGPPPITWNVDESIFAQRKKENEAHDLYDTDKVRTQQLLVDWKRVVSKARFRRMVAKGDLGVKEDGQSLDEELTEVREELERQAHFVRSAFVYYSMTSPGAGATSAEVFQMSASAWMTFCHDAGIVGKGCTGMDVQNIFVAVNFEEESETEEAAANDDDAMVRFEFMEGLVRVAFSKYINTKRMSDASDALGALLEEVVNTPTFPAEARVDPNDFRRNRFYTPEVEEVLKEYWDLLVGVFKLYKARDRARYLWPEHFMAFLESNQLLGPATGLTRREGKLIFGWSQTVVTDELRRRQRAVSLTQFDFIEAVARVADTISPPDVEEMAQFFEEEGQQVPELDRMVYTYYKTVGDAGPLLRRPSAGLLGASTRPLAPKLRLLLQYLVCTLREAWGGSDAKEVAAKVMRTATYLSGGIEMG